MHTAFQLYLFSAIVLAAPSIHYFSPRQNTTTGPCDAWAPVCQPVRVANACLAQFLNRAEDAQILKCVNDEDAAQAKINICTCYGCDTELEKWVKKTELCNV